MATHHWRREVLCTVAVSLLLASTVSVDAAAGTSQTSATARNRPTVLFLCPHGAAKSVLASAYFQQAAKERGLDVRVESAGTNPDDQVSPAVAEHLRGKGLDVPVVKPRQVTPQEVAAADVVISIGCDLTGLPVHQDRLQRWDEIPAPSEDLKKADEAIRRRVITLVDELLARQRK